MWILECGIDGLILPCVGVMENFPLSLVIQRGVQHVA